MQADGVHAALSIGVRALVLRAVQIVIVGVLVEMRAGCCLWYEAERELEPPLRDQVMFALLCWMLREAEGGGGSEELQLNVDLLSVVMYLLSVEPEKVKSDRRRWG
jgi:hypothetical protein